MRLFDHHVVSDPDAAAWLTPPHIFDALRLDFDLDVAGPPGGVPWIPAKRTLTREDDGLTHPWEGFVWMNPPYSRPSPWMERFATHGNGVALMVADTSTSWWQAFVPRCSVVTFLHGRVTFLSPSGIPARSGHFRYPVALIGAGPRATAAIISCNLGWTVLP